MGFHVAFEGENAFTQSNVSRWRLESSRWMEQQQKKCNTSVRCACEERPAAEHRMSAEPEVVHVQAC